MSIVFKSIFIVFTIYIGFKFIEWLIKYLKTLKRYKNVPGYPILPVIGHLHYIKNNGVDFLKLMVDMSRSFKNHPVFKIYRGWEPAIIFHTADYLEVLFSGNKHQVKSFDYDFLKPWLGDGLLISEGNKWSERRKLITPSFHFDILNDFLIVMNENVEICVSNLSKYADTGEEIDIFKHIGLCALDIICETAMGENIDAQNKSDSEYIKAVADMNILTRRRQMNPFEWNDTLYSFLKTGKESKKCLKILHDFTREIIIKRNDEFESSNFGTQKRIAFLDMLLKAKNTDGMLTFDDIQAEVDTFMFEGHDTTSCGTAWAFHCIGSHPEVQKKIHEELDSVFGDSERHFTNEDLGKLKYLERCIKESLRLFPSVPYHGRIVTEDTQIGDLELKKGLVCVIFNYMVHRDEKYYPEPEIFNPDRFLQENMKDRHTYAYIPFSAGKRNCIGQRFALMEMKVMIGSLLRKFKIKSLKTTEDLKPSVDIILKPTNGVPIKISRRKNIY